MNIIYVSSCCSEEKFNYMQKTGMVRHLPPAQKYHKLLMEGLVHKIDGQVYSVSAMPVNSHTTKKVFFPRETEAVNGINFIYDAFVNLPIIRQVTRYFRVKKEIKNICKREKDCVIICDVLVQSIADASRSIGKKLNVPVMGIVTDVPGFVSGADRINIPFYKKMFLQLIDRRAKKNTNKYDSYLFLTEDMNNIVNDHNVPFVVIEGHCDSKMALVENSVEKKARPKVIMYSGGIHREYGIERLVNGFMDAGLTDWELHVYGCGNYFEELTQISQNNSNIKFFGVVSNEIVVKKQTEAFLVVNPRPTDSDFVRYSFPSKNLEYMASGTAMLTTRLPGMPKEYLDYVYTIDDESVEGIKQKLTYLASLDEADLIEKGNSAKKFVLEEKNNHKQAEKVVDFINEKLLK